MDEGKLLFKKIEDKKLLNLIVMRNGGRTTMRIIDEILIYPKNANQLSKILNLDYKTVTYHLDIICRHKYISKEKIDNYFYYHPSDKLIKSLDEYMIIREQLRKEQ